MNDFIFFAKDIFTSTVNIVSNLLEGMVGLIGVFWGFVWKELQVLLQSLAQFLQWCFLEISLFIQWAINVVTSFLHGLSLFLQWCFHGMNLFWQWVGSGVITAQGKAIGFLKWAIEANGAIFIVVMIFACLIVGLLRARIVSKTKIAEARMAKETKIAEASEEKAKKLEELKIANQRRKDEREADRKQMVEGVKAIPKLVDGVKELDEVVDISDTGEAIGDFVKGLFE